MPRVGSLLDELSLVLGRALALGEAGSSALARMVSILGILVLGWVAHRILTAVIHRLLQPLVNATEDPVRAQRARTLGPLLVSVARYVVAFVVAMVVLQELGIDVRALAVSAGVVGVAIGFGAQSLIRDVITGFFILFENLVAVGDVIEVGSHVGVVEAVGLRVTRLRKFSGELRIVPNGELTAFGHHTATWSRAVVEVSVARDQDVDRVLAVLGAAGRALRAAHPADVLELPVAEGILRFGDADLVVRIHARVVALQKAPLEMELRRRIKAAFDREGVSLPTPRQVVELVPESTLAPPLPRAAGKESP